MTFYAKFTAAWLFVGPGDHSKGGSILKVTIINEMLPSVSITMIVMTYDRF